MLAVFFRFLRAPFANLSFSLEGNQSTCILLYFVDVGTMIGAPIAGFRRVPGSEPHHTARHEQKRQRFYSLCRFHPSLLFD